VHDDERELHRVERDADAAERGADLGTRELPAFDRPLDCPAATGEQPAIDSVLAMNGRVPRMNSAARSTRAASGCRPV
jgi:hypothetical protein